LVLALKDLSDLKGMKLGVIHEKMVGEKGERMKRPWTNWAKEFQYVFHVFYLEVYRGDDNTLDHRFYVMHHEDYKFDVDLPLIPMNDEVIKEVKGNLEIVSLKERDDKLFIQIAKEDENLSDEDRKNIISSMDINEFINPVEYELLKEDDLVDTGNHFEVREEDLYINYKMTLGELEQI